jgi:hypothetical protein
VNGGGYGGASALDAKLLDDFNVNIALGGASVDAEGKKTNLLCSTAQEGVVLQAG